MAFTSVYTVLLHRQDPNAEVRLTIAFSNVPATPARVQVHWHPREGV